MSSPKKNKPSEASEAVGYGKPPKHSQFKKGQSGNPYGRRKRNRYSKSVERMLKDSVLQEVNGTVNGKRQPMPLLQAIFIKQLANALQGDVRSAKCIFEIVFKRLDMKQSLAEMMEGRKVAEFTEEEAQLVSRSELLDGLKWPFGDDDEPKSVI